jgi:hypothetical protein
VSSLVRELRLGGYATIQQVEEVMNKTAGAFLAYEAEEPPEPAGVFNDVGVVRISISIVDDKFNDVRAGTKATPFDVKYKSLVKNK